MTSHHITSHAIDRYLERVEQCSRRDAFDRLAHAASIAIPASMKQQRWFSANRGHDTRLLDVSGKCVLMYCHIEALLLVCKRYGDCLRVVTVLRYSPAMECVA